jgi:hypothetical protein
LSAARKLLRIPSMSHAHKGVTLQAVSEALAHLGVLAPVLKSVPPEVRESLQYPHHRRYHPGTVLDETLAAIARLHGPEMVTKVMYAAIENTLVGVVAPLARIFLSLSGGGPRVLLERFELLIDSGARGFQTRWEATGDTAGRLVISTEAATPPEADFSWKGTLEFLLQFAQVEGAVTILPREREGRDCCLRVEWRRRPSA